MKAISVKQPWASLIFHGKDVENRTWKTNFRGTVLIHASSTVSGLASELLNEDQFDSLGVSKNMPLWLLDLMSGRHVKSAIIGTVDIVDCVFNYPSIWADQTEGVIDSNTKEFIPRHTPKPVYNWVLKNPVLFDKPILNVKGGLSFWEFDDSLIPCNHDYVTKFGVVECQNCGKEQDDPFDMFRKYGVTEVVKGKESYKI